MIVSIRGYGLITLAIFIALGGCAASTSQNASTTSARSATMPGTSAVGTQEPASMASGTETGGLPAGWKLDLDTPLDASVLQAIASAEKLQAEHFTACGDSLFDYHSNLGYILQHKMDFRLLRAVPLTAADKLNGIDGRFEVFYEQKAWREWNKYPSKSWRPWQDPGDNEVVWTIALDRTHAPGWPEATPIQMGTRQRWHSSFSMPNIAQYCGRRGRSTNGTEERPDNFSIALAFQSLVYVRYEREAELARWGRETGARGSCYRETG
jgi:hypothetical protein